MQSVRLGTWQNCKSLHLRELPGLQLRQSSHQLIAHQSNGFSINRSVFCCKRAEATCSRKLIHAFVHSSIEYWLPACQTSRSVLDPTGAKHSFQWGQSSYKESRGGDDSIWENSEKAACNSSEFLLSPYHITDPPPSSSWVLVYLLRILLLYYSSL